MKFATVVPWHNQVQLDKFLAAWHVSKDQIPSWLFLQQDTDRSGCAVTKNRGVKRAIDAGAEVVIVLDDDCFPHESQNLFLLAEKHLEALKPQQVGMFETVTTPVSRGTPYMNRSVTMPVAASMGFWTGVGDYDAPGQLVHGQLHPMEFKRTPIFGKYFPLCGMNLAFPADAWPWCQFIDVPRFDDIWQGFLWQKKAYADGKCFNLNGPLVCHSRQSNVWANLRAEAENLERNETIWSDILTAPLLGYEELKQHVGLK